MIYYFSWFFGLGGWTVLLLCVVSFEDYSHGYTQLGFRCSWETKGVSPTSLGHQVGWTGGTGAWLGLSLSMWTLIVQWFSSSSATGWLDPKKLQGILKPRLRNSHSVTSTHAVGQSKSEGHPRVKGLEKQIPHFDGRSGTALRALAGWDREKITSADASIKKQERKQKVHSHPRATAIWNPARHISPVHSTFVWVKSHFW